MQVWLAYAFYAALAAVLIVLAIGVANLVRTDANARSRSNHLMRMRVLFQFIAVMILVAIGYFAGAFK
ncbi:MAG: twin transmembrane helix small protein [Hyphomonadaceae bacterium]